MIAGLSLEPLGTELADVAAALRRSTVEIRTRGSGVGSGIVWDSMGTIVTNAHVARSDRAQVVFADGRELAGTVTARDPRRDLATITVDVAGTTMPVATMGHPTDLRTGDLVLALGNPLGISGALALGIVHVVERRRGAPRWIRADIRLAPGNSGGPLADVRGRVVGVNTLIANGLGMAVPITTVLRFLADASPGRRDARYRAA